MTICGATPAPRLEMQELAIEHQKSRTCGVSTVGRGRRRLRTRRLGRPGRFEEHHRGRICGRNLARQSEIPPADGPCLLREPRRPARHSRPCGHRDASRDSARHHCRTGSQGLPRRSGHHGRTDARKRIAPGDARCRKAPSLPDHRAKHARADDPSSQAQCRLLAHGGRSGKHRAAIAIRGDCDFADRLGGG